MQAKNRVPMIGKTFGKLTCIKEIDKKHGSKLYYLFNCSCGGTHEASGVNVRAGKVKWCKNCDDRHKPSVNRVPMVGKKFGNLTCIEELGSFETGKTKKKKELFCLLLCDCGNTHKASASNLKAGKITRCPKCKHKDRIFGNNHHQFNGYGEISSTYWSGMIYRAKIKNIEFSVTIEEAWDLFVKQNKRCALTGIELKMTRKAHNDTTATASLDRKNSKIGYNLENIQWVHKHINAMKNDYEQDYFIMLCKAVADRAQ